MQDLGSLYPLRCASESERSNSARDVRTLYHYQPYKLIELNIYIYIEHSSCTLNIKILIIYSIINIDITYTIAKIQL